MEVKGHGQIRCLVNNPSLLILYRKDKIPSIVLIIFVPYRLSHTLSILTYNTIDIIFMSIGPSTVIYLSTQLYVNILNLSQKLYLRNIYSYERVITMSSKINYNIYVTNTVSSTVSLIENNIVTKSILVGQNPVAMVLVKGANQEQFIYVVCRYGDISIIRLSDNTVMKTLRLNGMVNDHFNANIVFNSVLSRLYIACYNKDPKDNGYITVINTIEHTIETSINVQQHPTVMAMTNNKPSPQDESNELPDANQLYVINEGSRSISIIDLNNNSIIKTLDVKHSPETIVTTPDNKYFFIAYQTGDRIHIGDIKTNTIIGEKATPSSKTRYLYVSKDGKLLYAGLRHNNRKLHGNSKFMVIDIRNDFHTINDIKLAHLRPNDVKMIQEVPINDDYHAIYLLRHFQNKKNYLQKLVRQVSNNIIDNEKSISLKHACGYFAVTPDNRFVLVSFPGPNKIIYYSTDSLMLYKELTLGGGPTLLLVVDKTTTTDT